MSILLSLFYFFYFGVVGVYIIFMPKVLATLGYSAQDIGIIFAASPLVRFILPMLFIRGLELNTKMFNSALVVLSLSAISFYFSVYNFYTLLLSNIALGVGLSLIMPYVEVISLKHVGKEHYGKIRLFGSLGFVLVALVLVKVLSSEQTALLFLLALTQITVVVAFLVVYFSDKKEPKKSGKISSDISVLSDYKLWIGLTLMQVSFGAFYNFFTIYETAHGISMQVTIYLWSFGVLAEIVMLYFQGNFLKNNLLLLLQLTTFITALRWFLVFMFPENLIILYFSQSLHAFSFALFHSSAIAYLYDIYKHKALAQQFFSGITYGLGGLSGALLSGFIYERYPEYLFLSSAFIAFGAFVFVSLWRKEREYLG